MTNSTKCETFGIKPMERVTPILRTNNSPPIPDSVYYIKDHEVLIRLRYLINYTTKSKDLAKRFGVSQQFMSAVLSGKKPPTKKMLSAINIEKVTVYVEKDHSNDR